jgi:hypothetical protein
MLDSVLIYVTRSDDVTLRNVLQFMIVHFLQLLFIKNGIFKFLFRLPFPH